MSKETLIGLLKLTLAHHPLCWLYRNHTIKIFNTKFCLGCTAFYSGFFISSIIILFSTLFAKLNWFDLVLISTLLYLPTMFRLIKIPFFSTSKKYFRFLFRFLLGIGVGTGLLSIFVINNLIIQIIQISLGITLYTGITIQRVLDKEAFKECETC